MTQDKSISHWCFPLLDSLIFVVINSPSSGMMPTESLGDIDEKIDKKIDPLLDQLSLSQKPNPVLCNPTSPPGFLSVPSFRCLYPLDLLVISDTTYGIIFPSHINFPKWKSSLNNSSISSP